MMRAIVSGLLLGLVAPITAAAQAISLPELEQQIADRALGKIVAVQVEQNGETVYAQRFDRKNDDQLTDIRSAGKSLTALAVGILVDEGKLPVNTNVWPLLGSAANDPRNDITVRDLLTMSSSLDCSDSTLKSPGNEERMYRTKVWRDFAMNIPVAGDYTRDDKGYGRFSYCTAGVFLLGQVVEEVSGQRFDDFMAERVFRPLGIDDVKWTRSRSGEVQSGGQIQMRADDLLKIGRLVLDGGKYRGQQIVSGEWIKQMLQPHSQTGPYNYYGYLWWFSPVTSPRGLEPSWMMMGNGGNIISIYREYDAVIVVQARNYNKDDAHPNSFAIMRAVLEALPAPNQKGDGSGAD
ncbi:serine hydrolase [Pontixanthobacter aestiaquae]|uniref:Serine hydrolase n=1 Tax=Pontixanthobacter aestiaquae TaxID=1509367 RepID=A0A844Z3Q3_9SPHN|nr:serine hydrolase [Pontixanthobacter aestiaquae]MDN3646659.1 serine hydrolase [Pontixanthobacter aestiaquae]MXO82358.1 serine hydrolase [Pontixanthobacter aestiaquae]